MVAKICFSFLKGKTLKKSRLEQLFSYTIKFKRQRIKLRARFYLNCLAYSHISGKNVYLEEGEKTNHLDYIVHGEHVIH